MIRSFSKDVLTVSKRREVYYPVHVGRNLSTPTVLSTGWRSFKPERSVLMGRYNPVLLQSIREPCPVLVMLSSAAVRIQVTIHEPGKERFRNHD
jgi:hypothetical protein